MHWIFLLNKWSCLSTDFLTDNWCFLRNSKPTQKLQEKHLAKKIDVKYSSVSLVFLFTPSLLKMGNNFQNIFLNSQWNDQTKRATKFCTLNHLADKSTMCHILQESIILLCGCFCTNNQSWDIKSYRQYEPDVLSKQTTQLYFQKLPFRGQTKLELHPNLLEMHQKNDVPPSIHEADAIAYISNHKISELNLENPM